MSRTDALLAEIARPGSTRESIAALYADGLSAQFDSNTWDFVDWPSVNGALLQRYRPSGLDYIKARGWKLWEHGRETRRRSQG